MKMISLRSMIFPFPTLAEHGGVPGVANRLRANQQTEFGHSIWSLYMDNQSSSISAQMHGTFLDRQVNRTNRNCLLYTSDAADE